MKNPFTQSLLNLLLGGMLCTAVAGCRAGAVAENSRPIKEDWAAIRLCDKGLADVMEYARNKPELFTHASEDLLTMDEKRELLNAWKRFLDYQIALNEVGHRHRNYYQLDGEAEATSFFAGHAAAVTGYSYALEFLDLVKNNQSIGKLLDEEAPELGLDERVFSQLKFKVLNAGRGIEFAAGQVVYDSYARKYPPPDEKRIRKHAAQIWGMGTGRGPALTLKNAADVVRQAGFRAWLPVQTTVSEWMGDTKVFRPKKTLIKPDQIANLDLQPGDILLQRRDWYLSNVGLPGFWPHAALYIGTPAERDEFLNSAEVSDWVRAQGEPSGEFEKLLRKSFPESCERMERKRQGAQVRVLEAISEGVTFTTLEHSADADSLAVLRPRLSPSAKAAAIYRAFHFEGRPYDFNFDFDTDASLVCTELVCKAYEKGQEDEGLTFPIERILGRKLVPANAIVQQFDRDYGTERQQLDLVCFLDANEKSKEAHLSTVNEFRESWRRPKWHILVQDR